MSIPLSAFDSSDEDEPVPIGVRRGASRFEHPSVLADLRCEVYKGRERRECSK